MTRILLIRFSSIGDIVLTSPVIRCLKKQRPDAEIHFLTKKQYAPLLQANPYLSRIWEYDGNFPELLPELRRQRFDYIADLHRNFRSARVVLSLRRPCGTFPKLNLRKWLLTRFGIDRMPDLHITDRYFLAVSKLGIINDDQGLDYFIPPAEEVSPEILPVPFRNGYYAIVIGAKHATKIFPAERIGDLCLKLPKPAVLLGGPEDRDRARQIAVIAGDRVFDACGKYTVSQSASLIRQSEKVITNDTGLMHIAAALKKPVISLWGNTVPAFGMTPCFPAELKHLSSIVEVKGLSCRPCSKLGYDRCPKGHFDCMNRIPDEQILAAL